MAGEPFLPAMQALEARARSGEGRAMYELAAMLARQGRRDDSRAWLARAVEAGEPDAVFTSACLVLDGIDTPRDTARAVTMLTDASARGSASAMRTLAALHAMGEGTPSNWAAAMKLQRTALDAGDETARYQLCVLLDMPATSTRQDVAAKLDTGAIAEFPARPLPARIEMSRKPDVWRFEGLFTPLECSYLMIASAPLVHRSLVFDPQTGQPMRSTERTSGTASIHPLRQDIVMVTMNARLAAAAGLPVANGEMLSVLRYEPGQEYRPHFDFIEDNAAGSKHHEAGQRIATLLVSLNEGYEGGETAFLSNGMKWRGKPGDAILFANVDAAGEPDRTTCHAGTPVTSGTKWLLSKWYRERAYTP